MRSKWARAGQGKRSEHQLMPQVMIQLFLIRGFEAANDLDDQVLFDGRELRFDRTGHVQSRSAPVDECKFGVRQLGRNRNQEQVRSVSAYDNGRTRFLAGQ